MSNHQHWCIYCKNEIKDDETFVVRNDNDYHIKCFELLNGDTYGERDGSYTETDNE